VIGVDWGAWALRHPADQRRLIENIVEMVTTGRLHPPPPAREPLEAAPAVLASMLERDRVGKVVLVP
jgi:NADPH:quinone reductase